MRQTPTKELQQGRGDRQAVGRGKTFGIKLLVNRTDLCVKSQITL